MQALLEQCCISTLPVNKAITASLQRVEGKWQVVSPEDWAYMPVSLSVHTRSFRTHYLGTFNVHTAKGKQQYKFKGSCEEGKDCVGIVVERVV